MLDETKETKEGMTGRKLLEKKGPQKTRFLVQTYLGMSKRGTYLSNTVSTRSKPAIPSSPSELVSPPGGCQGRTACPGAFSPSCPTFPCFCGRCGRCNSCRRSWDSPRGDCIAALGGASGEKPLARFLDLRFLCRGDVAFPMPSSWCCGGIDANSSGGSGFKSVSGRLTTCLPP